MKQIETTKSGKNYKVINVGKFSDLMDYELPLGPDFTLHGKVFAGQAVGATGSDLSFQTLVPGQDSGFLHTHKTHEELYIILKGEGMYQVDGEQIPVSEGSIVRVDPAGKRALKNTGSENLTMMCIQYKANAFTEADSPTARLPWPRVRAIFLKCASSRLCDGRAICSTSPLLPKRLYGANFSRTLMWSCWHTRTMFPSVAVVW